MTEFKEPPTRDYHGEMREALKVAREALGPFAEWINLTEEDQPGVSDTAIPEFACDVKCYRDARTALAQIDKLIGGEDE